MNRRSTASAHFVSAEIPYDDYLALDEETLRRMTAVQGPDHPDTLFSRSNLALGYSDVPEGVFLLRATGVRDTYEGLVNRALYRGRPRPTVPLPPPHRVEIVEVWFGTGEPRRMERERATLEAWIRDRWSVERPATRKQRAFVEAFQVEVVDDAERVHHPKFGGGVVLERRDDRCVVRFDDGSTRTLLASVLVAGE